MYSNQQVTDMKQIIEQHFKNPEIYQKLKQKIQQQSFYFRDKLKMEDLTNENLIKILKDLNLMDQILVDVQDLNKEEGGQIFKFRIDTSDTQNQYILLQITGGSAFLDFINPNKNQLIIYINFQENQYQTEPIQAQVEPSFNQQFKLKFNIDPFAQRPTFNHLLQLDQQIELVICTVSTMGNIELYAQKLVEWRYLLSFGSVSANLELTACQQRLKLLSKDAGTLPSVGILNIKMDIMPKSMVQLVPEKVLNDAIAKEKKFKDLDMIRFYDYSNNWWNEYKSISKQFDQRNVKIYAESEDGQFLPVYCFVNPLNTIVGIDTPFHASRFVSLIPLQKNSRPGGDKIEMWSRFHTMLAQQRGEVEDHCNLLCSLFLGFGMNAYVVIGTNMNDYHAWVVTINDDKATFWESLSGQRYDQKDPRCNSLFKKVACAFNHNSFYANIQTNDLGPQCDFNFSDLTKWKGMASDMIQVGNKKIQQQITQMPPNPQLINQQEVLTMQIKQMIRDYRFEKQLQTKFDKKLEYILSPALYNYEQDKISQQTCGAEEFQFAIKNYLQENTSFKAFPIQFITRDPQKIFQSLLYAPVCKQILDTMGNEVFFAVRTKLVLYQANIFALWVTVAVRYYANA